MKTGRLKSLKIKGEFDVMMLGNESVGKSSLLHCFLSDRTSSTTATIGAEKYVKTILIKNGMIRVKFCDTSGQARFKELQRTYYKTCNGAMVLYDIQNRKSFDEAKEWVKELREKVSPDLIIALAGNKKDMHENRVITIAEANTYATENNLIFMETSALTAVNVDICFMALVNALYAQHRTRHKIAKKEKKKNNNIFHCCGLYCCKT